MTGTENTDKGPVRVRLYVSTQWVGAEDEEYIEIPRDEWDAMTPAERCECLDEEAGVFMSNMIEHGWTIEDDEDEASTAGGAK